MKLAAVIVGGIVAVCLLAFGAFALIHPTQTHITVSPNPTPSRSPRPRVVHVPQYVPVPAPPAQTAGPDDPFAVVQAYFSDLSAPQDLASVWVMLSPAMQAQVDGYGQWAASRSNIDLETVTEVSESGDQVTVNLDQVRNGRAETMPRRGSRLRTD